MPEKLRTLLSTSQVATLLGFDIRKVQRMAEAEQLPAFKLPGATGAYVYDEAAILELIAA